MFEGYNAEFAPCQNCNTEKRIENMIVVGHIENEGNCVPWKYVCCKECQKEYLKKSSIKSTG